MKMANKIDYFVSVLFIFIFVNLVIDLYLYNSAYMMDYGCSFFSASNCFYNLYSTYSIWGLDVTPIINFFYFIYDGIMLLASIFFISIAIPNAPFLIQALVDGMNGILIGIMIISILPFISGG